MYMNLDLKDVISFVEKLKNEISCVEKGLNSKKYNFENQEKAVLIISDLKNNIEKSITDLEKLI